MFRNNLWSLKCTEDFIPFFTKAGSGKCKANFTVHTGDLLKVHDKFGDKMWEVSYPNGTLLWTDVSLLKECCETGAINTCADCGVDYFYDPSQGDGGVCLNCWQAQLDMDERYTTCSG